MTDSRGLRSVVGAVTFSLMTSVALAGQMEPSTYYLLRKGMKTSELLVRAGPPDLMTVPGGEIVERRLGSRGRGRRGGLSFDSFRRTEVRNIEEWHYIPGPDYHDPWITVVTLRSGRIFDVQRTKVFSRYRGARASGRNAARASEPGASRDRTNRAVEAAERYAAIRSRLKEKMRREAGAAVEPEVAPAAKIHRGTDVHGASDFGDGPAGVNATCPPIPRQME